MRSIAIDLHSLSNVLLQGCSQYNTVHSPWIGIQSQPEPSLDLGVVLGISLFWDNSCHGRNVSNTNNRITLRQGPFVFHMSTVKANHERSRHG